MQTYKVNRQHLGDKMYMPGDTREAAPGDVNHLVANGVLEADRGEKSEAVAKNKAEPAVANKVDALDHDGDGRKGGVKKA